MGSASRAALASAVTALAGEKGVTLATGEQLLSAGRDIAGSPQLRSTLVDPSIDEAAKSKLIGKIFGSLDAVTARLLSGLTTARWSDSDELIDGIEQIGIRAIAAASPQASIESELFAFARAVTSDNELELAVGSTLSDPLQKAALVERLLGAKANPATVSIVRHLVQSPRGRRIGELLQSAAETVADASGGIVATVTAAAPLSAAQLEKLTSTLTTQYGREPRIALRIDPAVIGGLRVQIGEDVIDGTVAARLADLRLQLAG
ncbi:F0F1 ATP synthase subunit delta [Pseudolysinimonas yzui]|uniref:ATP synthase subunit delta n=1 Tax=Pseudolysinimonas yzui TaxID=2708254 RepID=A0A8J3GNF1_9MICO|nr:F0F1 ATP synthase subunit delta [Pseudolysinimonas yzui]GHF07170.1 ATP synthase subunit delta [Pseudolysinimonas yzui]